MKLKKLLLILTVIVFMAVFAFASNSIADFGDFGGDSDYGGGGSDWGGGGSDWGDSDYGGGGSGGSLGITITVMVIVAVVILLINVLGKKKTGGAQPAGAAVTDASRLRSIAEYRQKDPRFSEPELQGKISNLYVKMQNCWTAKNLEPLRPYFTDMAYAQFDRQLDSYRMNYRTNYVERIAVLGVELRGWYEEEGNDCIVAAVRTRIVDYVVDDNTRSIVSGSNTAEKFMTYEYIMIRSSGYAARAQDMDAAMINCPNCGSPLNINYSAQCQYCGSIITTRDYDWVISSIKGISQQTM